MESSSLGGGREQCEQSMIFYSFVSLPMFFLPKLSFLTNSLSFKISSDNYLQNDLPSCWGPYSQSLFWAACWTVSLATCHVSHNVPVSFLLDCVSVEQITSYLSDVSRFSMMLDIFSFSAVKLYLFKMYLCLVQIFLVPKLLRVFSCTILNRLNILSFHQHNKKETRMLLSIVISA